MPRVSARRGGSLGLALLLLGGLLYLLPGPSPSSTGDDRGQDSTSPPLSHRLQQQVVEEDYSVEGGSTGPPALRQAKQRPWFMSGGKGKGVPGAAHKLWPAQLPDRDRIPEQLMFVPAVEPKTTKVVLLFNGLGSWAAKLGSAAFADCPVSKCSLSASKPDWRRASAILFKDHFVHPGPGANRPLDQVWILYMLECPYHTQHVKYNDVFNWTATYRVDSDIVAPYERWVYHDDAVRTLDSGVNFAANKTKQVAWFVSNCGARNGRLQYAKELAKHIKVDVYGACGSKKCPRSNQEKCFDMLNNDYKFYLAFENSNCKDYITEKFFVNGLGRNILPVVMGARPEDYEKVAPHHSYIHVDDFPSPKHLARYLHKLDADDQLYNSYFRWKGTGEFINTHFFCRLCALLHDEDAPVKSYRNINVWWRGSGTCTAGSWRRHEWFKEPS